MISHHTLLLLALGFALFATSAWAHPNHGKAKSPAPAAAPIPAAPVVAVKAVAPAKAVVAVTATVDLPKRWYKGNLHTHSLWSDGNDFPEMICSWYKAQGYHFLGLSDHNLLSQGEKWVDSARTAQKDAIGGLERFRGKFPDRVQTKMEGGKTLVRLTPYVEFRKLFEEPERFLLIQAEEITDSYKTSPIHINASNIQEFIRPQRGDSLRETISNNLIAIENQSQRLGVPILGHLNHPNYGYAVTAEDMAAVLEEKFFEVYNGHPGINHLGDKRHASIERMWDIANSLRIGKMHAPPLYGMGTDDSHNYFGDRGASPGRGWVQVRSEKLAPAELIRAMQRGDFYASSGVELKDVRYDAASRRLDLEVNPAEGVSYTIELIGTPASALLEGKPVLGDDGQPLRATLAYSPDIGKVLQRQVGASASFQLTGDELYVRAVVTSSRPPLNPSFKDQKEQAWTQPVGWEGRMR